MTTSTIVFNRRNRLTSDGFAPVEIRITANRKSYFISTGVKVRLNEWKGGRVCNRVDADEMNRRLDAMILAAEKEITDCIIEQRPVSVSLIRRSICNAKAEGEGQAVFLDWYEEQLDSLGVAEGTLKHYITTLARLREYNIIRVWGDLTPENIVRFDAWLHKIEKKISPAQRLRGEKCGRISNGGVYTYHKNLKTIINRAIKFGLLSTNPYARLRGEFKRGDNDTITYLTDEEMERIKRLEPTDSMTRTARDLFIFQAYTGLSYSDAQAFDFNNYKNIDGRWINVGQRIKTGVPYVSRLLSPAVEVLERYGWQVPRISNQKYNQALKAIGAACGISTRMHTHLARHTFATWMLRNGVRVENLRQMLGHTRIEQTMRYAKVVAQSVHDDFDMIEAKIMSNK